MEISKVPFGTYKGDPVTKYILTNDNGVQVGILDFAGLLQSFKVPTKDGGKADMILTSVEIRNPLLHSSLPHCRLLHCDFS